VGEATNIYWLYASKTEKKINIALTKMSIFEINIENNPRISNERLAISFFFSILEAIEYSKNIQNTSNEWNKA
jgi:hypothetical protein